MSASDMNDVRVRVPPYSAEAEQSVIGALLLDNQAFDRVVDVVGVQDFYLDAHRRIFRHVAALIDAGQAADVVTVSEAIERANEVDQTGGIAYLGELANNTPSAANIRRYAEIVADRCRRRALMAVGNEISISAEGPGASSAEERIDEALGKVMALAESKPSDSEPEAVGDILPAVMANLQEMFEAGGSVAGRSTGFADLDKMTSGLCPGDMVVVAGRPAMGKTAFALNVGENMALDGEVVLVFSLEMTKPQLTNRLLASIGRIELGRLRNGRLQEDDWDKMTLALAKLNDAKLVIDDTGGMTLPKIRARARREKRRRGGLGLIVIDYLQLIEDGRGGGENRNAELTAISRGIKAMAKELKVPVIALSQLSRKVEERKDRRPMLSDLRESGAIEQDADLVLMLYRDEYYNPDTQSKGLAEVIIAKQRSGPTGDVHLAFNPSIGRFANLAYGDRPAQSKVAPKTRGFRE